jgi:hypothetical protein
MILSVFSNILLPKCSEEHPLWEQKCVMRLIHHFGYARTQTHRQTDASLQEHPDSRAASRKNDEILPVLELRMMTADIPMTKCGQE